MLKADPLAFPEAKKGLIIFKRHQQSPHWAILEDNKIYNSRQQHKIEPPVPDDQLQDTALPCNTFFCHSGCTAGFRHDLHKPRYLRYICVLLTNKIIFIAAVTHNNHFFTFFKRKAVLLFYNHFIAFIIIL